MTVLRLRDLARHVSGALADRLADVSASRMQHQPNRLLFVEAYLDKVVTASESPDLSPDATFIKPSKSRTNLQAIKAIMKLVDLSVELERLEASSVVNLRRRLMKVEPHRHIALYLRSDCRQAIRQVRRC